MKIIDARTGKVMPVVSFNLGEAGRGRHLEEVRIDSRFPPKGEEVGYKLFGGDSTKGHKPHVVLTAQDSRQRGILVRINTSGCYTKGSCGSIVLKGGDAEVLTEGTWAEGDAGRIGNGPDALWHVRGPALFVVTLQGGDYKGFGHRYLIVTKTFKVVMIKRDALCQCIATDDDPEVIEAVRQFVDDIHEDVKNALRVADELDAAASAPVIEVQHFIGEGTNLSEVVQGWKIAVPAAFASDIGGVSGVQAGTLMPGEKKLLTISVGPGGGRRYGYTVLVEEGFTRLASEQNHKQTSESLLGLVESPEWCIAWIERRDGEITGRYLANSGGIHRFNPTPNPDYYEEVVMTTQWHGHDVKTPSVDELSKLFEVTVAHSESIACPTVQAVVEVTAPVAQPVVETVTDGEFTHAAGRDFRCPKGHIVRASKEAGVRYQAGGSIELTCSISGCGTHGTATKPVAAEC